VLALFGIGGSMDWHIKLVEELFSAARTEFKHLAHFYFHNCLYEKVWKETAAASNPMPEEQWDYTTPSAWSAR
jgi:uncharacterized protein with von Willebrand factor type A (vWA) domain